MHGLFPEILGTAPLPLLPLLSSKYKKFRNWFLMNISRTKAIIIAVAVGSQINAVAGVLLPPPRTARVRVAPRTARVRVGAGRASKVSERGWRWDRGAVRAGGVGGW